MHFYERLCWKTNTWTTQKMTYGNKLLEWDDGTNHDRGFFDSP